MFKWWFHGSLSAFQVQRRNILPGRKSSTIRYYLIPGPVAEWIERPLALGSNPAPSMNMASLPRSLKPPQSRAHPWIFEWRGRGEPEKNLSYSVSKYVRNLRNIIETFKTYSIFKYVEKPSIWLVIRRSLPLITPATIQWTRYALGPSMLPLGTKWCLSFWILT